MHPGSHAPPLRRAVLCGIVAALAAAAPSAGAPAAIEDKRAELAALQERLADVDARAGAAAAAHNAALDRRDALAARIGATARRTRGTEAALAASRADLERRLVRLYVTRAPGPLEVILSSSSLTDAVQALAVLERAADADAAAVRQLGERRRELGRLRARLAGDAEAAARELATARERRAELDGILAERRARVAEAEDELGELMAAERRRQARLEARRRAQVAAERAAGKAAARAKARAEVRAEARADARGSAPAAAAEDDGASTSARAPASLPAGSHVFPLAGPSHFSDDFLFPRPGGRLHEGIDLFAARGTPVVAVAGGTLFRVGYSGVSGNRLWLRDAAGTEFFYAHLDAFAPAAREGAYVEKGTVLGYNGDTGDARGTSPHLHFEIHPGGGGPTRPYPIVSSWPRMG